MQTPPKTGTTHELKFVVGESHTVSLAPGELPLVLSSPSLIWFLEHAALDLMAPFLDSGELTVGTYIEMEHMSASRVGEEVTCRARVVHSDGPVVSFQVEASAADGTQVARGLHRRRVVSAARLKQRLEQPPV